MSNKSVKGFYLSQQEVMDLFGKETIHKSLCCDRYPIMCKGVYTNRKGKSRLCYWLRCRDHMLNQTFSYKAIHPNMVKEWNIRQTQDLTERSESDEQKF